MAVREDVYTYGDANWKDKLTAYDGKPITYHVKYQVVSFGYIWKTL